MECSTPRPRSSSRYHTGSHLERGDKKPWLLPLSPQSAQQLTLVKQTNYIKLLVSIQSVSLLSTSIVVIVGFLNCVEVSFDDQ